MKSSEVVYRNPELGEMTSLELAMMCAKALPWTNEMLARVRSKRVYESVDSSVDSSTTKPSTVKRFLRRSLEIEAIRFTNESISEVIEWVGIAGGYCFFGKIGLHQMLVDTAEGAVKANIGDWITRDIRGRFSVHGPVAFEILYEPVA